MPSVPRGPKPVPRRVTNDVGAAVQGPSWTLKWDEWIPVWVLVSWDDGAREVVKGWATAYTREFVAVQIRDATTGLNYNAWVAAADVKRREVVPRSI